MTTRNIRRLALLASAAPCAFENKAGWKLDADGKIEMKDGQPIYINSAGAEMTVQGDTIANLNGEAKTHREAKELAESKLKAYEVGGKLIDPAVATKAIETVSKLDAKQLIDAGEVDRVKETIKAEFTGQLNEWEGKYKALESDYNSNRIASIFDSSEFVRDRVAVPSDMFRASFEKNFKIEDGKPVAYDRAGNRLMSKQNVGQYADPNEAIELLVDAHPQKDSILKAAPAGGSGNQGGGGHRGGGRIMKVTEFDALGPQQKAEAAAAMGKNELTIVD